MSYSIYIGEACLEASETELTAEWIVKQEEEPDAPTCPGDDMTGRSNYRAPGTLPWINTISLAGLDDLFFQTDHGLMRDERRISHLTEAHYQEIHAALEHWQKCHPHATPRFGLEVADEDAVLARLIWLDWWVRWALNNCVHPALYYW